MSVGVGLLAIGVVALVVLGGAALAAFAPWSNSSKGEERR